MSKLALSLVLVSLFACNKDVAEIEAFTATISVMNAISTSPINVKVNFTGKEISFADAETLEYFSFDGRASNGIMNMGIRTGVELPLIIVRQEDTLKPIYHKNLTFNVGDVYSLFLTGSGDVPTVLLMKDSIFHYTDSLTGIRFINLSPDSGPLSINLLGNIGGSEVVALPYKAVSSYKTYPATSNNLEHIFEIRNASTGDVLATYSYNRISRFSNTTLVIRGQVNDWPGLEVVEMNN